MLTIVSDRWTSFFFDKHWWSRAWQAAFRFAPACIPASVVLTLANLTVVFASSYVPQQFRKLMTGLDGSNVTNGSDLGGLLLFFLAILVMLIVVLVLALWALSQWMFKLTAFARAFTWKSASIDASVIMAAEEHTKQRWLYSMKLWLLASLYMMLPMLLLSLFIGMHAVFSSQLVDVSQMGLPKWVTSTETRVGALIVGSLLMIICTAYTFIGIVFAAVSELSPWRTATLALTQCLQHFMALFALTVLILTANIVVTAPQMLIGMINSAPWAHSPLLEAGGQIWLGIISPIVWPLSVAPFCQITRQIQPDSHD